MMRILRFLGEIWALPWSLVGLAVAVMVGEFKIERYGVTYVSASPRSRLWDWWVRRWGFAAITIGTVTICDPVPPRGLLEHEARHQRQARILGPFYVPVYLVGCFVGWLRGKWYRRNPLEEDARGR